MTTGKDCAAGIFPLTGDIDTADPLMLEQFAPRIDITEVDGVVWAYCHLCEMKTLVKRTSPRKGFFVPHSASSQGYKSFSDKRSGKPARVRGREVYVRNG